MTAALERRVAAAARRHGPLALRGSVAVMLIWFGALKAIGATPVADLVVATVEMPLDLTLPGWFVPAFGWFEVALGLALLAGHRLRLIVPLACVHLLGTFAVFVTQPDVAFYGNNPLLLTVEGEFVAKNIVLLAAVLVAGAHTRSPASQTQPTPDIPQEV